jgi:hypothetical protein
VEIVTALCVRVSSTIAVASGAKSVSQPTWSGERKPSHTCVPPATNTIATNAACLSKNAHAFLISIRRGNHKQLNRRSACKELSLDFSINSILL